MSIGVVIIGRNEGERLVRCLASVGGGIPVVYVDSGSTDSSVDHARAAGARVVQLDMNVPFTAARARNAGAEELLQAHPAIRHIQFVDGDSELEPGWLTYARGMLDDQPKLAALSGRIREKFPERSIYNRLADREWDVATGETDSCAGICAMRVEAFRAVGGFDSGVAAGEEPELCQRLRRGGHIIMRIAEPMAIHDIALLGFGQWWRRQVRGGYGGTDVARRFGHRSFERQIRSARIWGLAVPVGILALGVLCAARPSNLKLAAFIASLLIIPAQALRLGWRAKRRGFRLDHAIMHGALTMIAKWAHLLGQYRWLRSHRAGTGAAVIDKLPASGPLPRASMGR